MIFISFISGARACRVVFSYWHCLSRGSISNNSCQENVDSSARRVRAQSFLSAPKMQEGSLMCMSPRRRTRAEWTSITCASYQLPKCIEDLKS